MALVETGVGFFLAVLYDVAKGLYGKFQDPLVKAITDTNREFKGQVKIERSELLATFQNSERLKEAYSQYFAEGKEIEVALAVREFVGINPKHASVDESVLEDVFRRLLANFEAYTLSDHQTLGLVLHGYQKRFHSESMAQFETIIKRLEEKGVALGQLPLNRGSVLPGSRGMLGGEGGATTRENVWTADEGRPVETSTRLGEHRIRTFMSPAIVTFERSMKLTLREFRGKPKSIRIKKKHFREWLYADETYDALLEHFFAGKGIDLDGLASCFCALTVRRDYKYRDKDRDCLNNNAKDIVKFFYDNTSNQLRIYYPTLFRTDDDEGVDKKTP